jgi:hypothetical protein
MTVQQISQSHAHPFVERMTAAARGLSRRVNDIAYRTQLGPSRDPEARDFRPSRRR